MRDAMGWDGRPERLSSSPQGFFKKKKFAERVAEEFNLIAIV